MMKSEIKEITIRELINYHKEGDLKPNWEYQRGLVWKEAQMRMLIDSILRGYTIPLIYIHKKVKKVAGQDSVRLEVIDGQQRINTFAGFVEDCAIFDGPEGKRTRPFNPLFDPTTPEGKRKFPIAMEKDPVPKWAGRKFSTLSVELKNQFLDTKVQVVYIECSDLEAKDLFIRLQGGRALSPQEIRDSRPGDYCEQVLQMGGKIQLNKMGHDFFRKLTVAKAGDVKTRQLVAQVFMLFLLRRENIMSNDYFTTVQSGELDVFYLQKVDMKDDEDKIKRFNEILDKLHKLFFEKTSLMQGHTVIHLVLLVDMLMDLYAPVWEDHIVDAHNQFMGNLAKIKREFKNEYPSDEEKDIQSVWNYDKGTRQRSDSSESIKHRHMIYVELMLKYMKKGLKPLDPKRAYTAEERELIFFRDKVCYYCKGKVGWKDAEIHHLTEHSQGGQTTLENGVLVHKECHPRGRPPKNK